MAKSKGGAAAEDTAIRLTRHPRAQRHIATAKGWGGLVAFAVTVYLSHGAGLPLADAVLRGMLGGIAGYLVAWMVAVTVWRYLALAELERLRVEVLATLEAQAMSAAAATGAVVSHGEAPMFAAEPAAQR